MYLEFYGRHRLPSYITFGYRLAVFFFVLFFTFKFSIDVVVMVASIAAQSMGKCELPAN